MANAEYFLTNFKIGGSPPYKCLNMLLKRTNILQQNLAETLPNLCNFFLQFPNVTETMCGNLVWRSKEVAEQSVRS